jgi:hypothetical protein
MSEHKDLKRFGSLLLISLMLSVFLVGVVSAQSAGDNFFKQVIDGFKTGDVSDYVLRIFILVIIIILVLSVSDRIPGLGEDSKAWLRFVIAVVVGILASAFFTVGELKVIIAGYSALAFVLAIGLPFLILVFFTYDLLDGKTGIRKMWARKFFMYLLWGGFGLFLIYRIFTFSTGGAGSVSIPDYVKYLHYIMLGLVIVGMLVAGWLFKKFAKAKFQETKEIMSRTFEDARLQDEADAQEIRKMKNYAQKLDKKR